MGFKTEQFVEKVDENLKCSICLEVLEDPWQCKDGHTFCIDCITQCLEEKHICPVGNNALRLDSLARSLLAKNMIENLEVYCHLPESEGETEAKIELCKCDWTGKLQALAKHREICPFQQVQCPNVNCNTDMQRRELEEHDKICEDKILECDEQCGVTLIRRDLPNHKTNDCPEVSLSCPNECGESIKRKNIKLHRETCPLQQVQCPNVDCNTNMQRRELEDHDKICEYKEVECEKCRQVLLRYKLPAHKDEDCPEEMVACPNSCKSTETGQINKIKRIDKEDHLNSICPKTILDCPFKDQGCSVRVERQHVEKHVQDNMAAHMMLLAKQCSSLTAQNSAITEQSTIVTKEWSSLTQQSTELSEQCSISTIKWLLSEDKNTTFAEDYLSLKQSLLSVIEENRLLKDEVKKNDERSRTYTWRITNYWDYYPKPAGRLLSFGSSNTSLRSPTFCLCGLNWNLLLYPNGDSKENRGFVSVHLLPRCNNYDSREHRVPSNAAKTPNTASSVTCRLSIISKIFGIPDISSQQSSESFNSSCVNSAMQWPRFINSDHAVSAKYCVDGGVTIQCTIQLNEAFHVPSI